MLKKILLASSLLSSMLPLSKTYAFDNLSALSTGEWRLFFESAFVPDNPNLDGETFGFESLNFRQGGVYNDFYSGNDRFHWRFISDGSYWNIRNESTDQCLVASTTTPNVTLGSCSLDGAEWAISNIRAESAGRAGLHRLQSKTTRRYLAYGGGANQSSLSADNSRANIFIEKAGWGDRDQATPDYYVRTLLLILRETDIPARTVVNGTSSHNVPASSGTIDTSTVNNLRRSYEKHLPSWIAQITDNKVNFTTDVIETSIPVTDMELQIHYSESGAPSYRYLPRAEYIQDHVNALVNKGQYDAIQVAFTSGTMADGGWGYNPAGIPNAYEKHSNWTTINALNNSSLYTFKTYRGDTSSKSEPTEVFIHEHLHVYDEYMQSVLPHLNKIPNGAVHGGHFKGYAGNNNQDSGHLHFYRDYWLGRIVGENGNYEGLGEAVFKESPVRVWAVTKNNYSNFVHAAGKCISAIGDNHKPAAGDNIELSTNCDTLGQAFDFTSKGHIKHIASGLCVRPKNGLISSEVRLEFTDCNEPLSQLEFEITNGNSLKHRSSGYCIHPLSGTADPNNGTPLVLFNACNESRLEFSYQERPLNFVHSDGKCISSHAGQSNPANGTNIYLKSDCSSDGQNFKLLDNGSIQHVSSGKCLHPSGGFAVNAIPLVLWSDCNGNPAKLAYEITSFGSLKHKSSGLCIHPSGGALAPNENTKLYLHRGCDEERLRFDYMENK